ncbi:MAG TPA: GntR family transcriptional regulator [Rhodopila sp.]|nr:GntR family transcriptional regulator [Rhodopila sp.]
MSIDGDPRLPLHAQLEEHLAQEISSGTLAPGSCLPPEHVLSERYGVSRTTIRTAIQSLVRRGLVEIRRGKGTFVTLPKITQELTHLTGFVEDMHALGRVATAKVLGRGLIAANAAVAARLGVPKGHEVVRIQRLRIADGVALSFDETYLPRALGERIMEDDLEATPIFTLLEQKYGTPLLEAEYRLEAVSADPRVARALGIAAGSPIFLIERTSFSRDHRPVDYERLYYRGDHVRFVTRLARRTSS